MRFWFYFNGAIVHFTHHSFLPNNVNNHIQHTKWNQSKMTIVTTNNKQSKMITIATHKTTRLKCKNMGREGSNWFVPIANQILHNNTTLNSSLSKIVVGYAENPKSLVLLELYPNFIPLSLAQSHPPPFAYFHIHNITHKHRQERTVMNWNDKTTRKL